MRLIRIAIINCVEQGLKNLRMNNQVFLNGKTKAFLNAASARTRPMEKVALTLHNYHCFLLMNNNSTSSSKENSWYQRWFLIAMILSGTMKWADGSNLVGEFKNGKVEGVGENLYALFLNILLCFSEY